MAGWESFFLGGPWGPAGLRALPFDEELLHRNQFDWCYFVRIQLPTITLYLTPHRNGNVTADVAGTGLRLWSAADVIAGALEQNGADILAVAWISLANGDNTWNNFLNTTWPDGTYGLRRKRVDIYRGVFDPDTGDLSGAYLIYPGRIDNQRHGSRSVLSLLPFGAYFGERKTPSKSAEDLEPDLWGRLMPDDTVNDYWGTIVPVQSSAEAAYQDQLYRNWLMQRRQGNNFFGLRG